MVSGIRIFFGCLAMLGILGTMNAVAEVSVKVDRAPVRINESFQIIFEADFEVSGRPDFSPLTREMQILRTMQSTQIRIMNGKRERMQRFNIDVMAKREGLLKIPSIVFDGKQSNEIIVMVLPAVTAGQPGAGTEDVFIQVETDTTTPYVQAQVNYTVRLFYTGNLSRASLSEPTVSTGDAVIERLGEDNSYRTQRNGRDYQVVERRYLVFPQASGPVRIDPLTFEGTTGNGRLSLFDLQRRNSRVIRLRSEPVDLDVAPAPTGFPGKTWLPARRIYLQEDWPESDTLPVGEPSTRTITIVAEGLLASQLPDVGTTAPGAFKQYPDQPVLENRAGPTGVTGIRQEKIALIPSVPGEYVMPEIELRWWNTQTNQVEFARLPSRTIVVSGALPSAAEPVTADVNETAPDGAMNVPADAGESPWIWISLGLALGWLITVAWMVRRGAGATARERPSSAVKPPSLKSIASSLKATCAANDPAGARDTLLRWGSIKWPGNSASSLGDIGARIDGSLQQEIHRLSRHLYRSGSEAWDGSALWTSFCAYRKASGQKPAPEPEPALEPLFRI